MVLDRWTISVGLHALTGHASNASVRLLVNGLAYLGPSAHRSPPIAVMGELDRSSEVRSSVSIPRPLLPLLHCCRPDGVPMTVVGFSP
jgi:hypothetical protein